MARAEVGFERGAAAVADRDGEQAGRGLDGHARRRTPGVAGRVGQGFAHDAVGEGGGRRGDRGRGGAVTGTGLCCQGGDDVEVRVVAVGEDVEFGDGLAGGGRRVAQRGGRAPGVGEASRRRGGDHDRCQAVGCHIMQLDGEPVPFRERREPRDLGRARTVRGQRGPLGAPAPPGPAQDPRDGGGACRHQCGARDVPRPQARRRGGRGGHRDGQGRPRGGQTRGAPQRQHVQPDQRRSRRGDTPDRTERHGGHRPGRYVYGPAAPRRTSSPVPSHGGRIANGGSRTGPPEPALAGCRPHRPRGLSGGCAAAEPGAACPRRHRPWPWCTPCW